MTRKAVLKVAKERGFTLKEREILFGEIEGSDGAFVTSTSSKILPIRSIDAHALAAPPAQLKALMAAFDAFLIECKGMLSENTPEY